MSEECHRCGQPYEYVYRVPNSVWAKIAPRTNPVDDPEHHGGGMLCVACADKVARNFGIQLYFDAHAGDWPENTADQLATKDRQIAELKRGVQMAIDHIAGNSDRFSVREGTPVLYQLRKILEETE